MKAIKNLEISKLESFSSTNKQQFSMKKLMNKKSIITGVLVFLGITKGIAQETAITDKITVWSESIKLILDAGVGVFALVGGFIIFLQYMQGNDQAQKNFVKFVIGLAIFGLVDLIAKVFLPG